MSLTSLRTGASFTPRSDEIGSGGIGHIFEVEERRDRVFKRIDPHFCTIGRHRKLEALIALRKQLPSNSLLRDHIAWPTDIMSNGSDWCGYLMERVASPRSLEEVCADAHVSSAMRLQLGETMATIVDELHALGIVVGDLSLKNCLYDTVNMRMVLIDPDSFQVAAGSIVYAVGESLEKSPEMLRNGTQRALTSRSDDFLFALALHRLLFLTHPLDDGTDDSFAYGTSICENTKNRTYPYLKNQNPFPLNTFGEDIKKLFIRSFTGSEQGIPTMKEWQACLHALAHGEGLHVCDCCGLSFSTNLKSCPSCNTKAPKVMKASQAKAHLAKACSTKAQQTTARQATARQATARQATSLKVACSARIKKGRNAMKRIRLQSTQAKNFRVKNFRTKRFARFVKHVALGALACTLALVLMPSLLDGSALTNMQEFTQAIADGSSFNEIDGYITTFAENLCDLADSAATAVDGWTDSAALWLDDIQDSANTSLDELFASISSWL